MRLRLQNNRVVIPKESTRFGVVRLTLTELEVLTSLRLTRFLTLNLTSVTSHEAFCLQRSLVFRIDFHQRTSDSEAKRLCLAFEATAVKRYLDIVLLCYAEFVQRLENDIAQNRRREISLDVATVDHDLAGTFIYVNAGYCLFTTS